MGIKDVECEAVEFIKFSRDIQYIDQQMHLKKTIKCKPYKTIHDKCHPFIFSAPECLLQ